MKKMEVENLVGLSLSTQNHLGIVQPAANSLGVCVKPVHFHYNKTYQLIQFIELNRLLGVSRFVSNFNVQK